MSIEQGSLQRLRTRIVNPPLVLLDKAAIPATLDGKIIAINNLHAAGFITNQELQAAQRATTLIRNTQRTESAPSTVRTPTESEQIEILDPKEKQKKTIEESEEPDFDKIPDTDEFDDFSTEALEVDDFRPEEVTLFERKRKLPKPEPEPSHILYVTSRKAKAPNGRDMELRPQEFAIYSSIMSGKTQEEIIKTVFNGNTTAFLNYLSNLTDELDKRGYAVTFNSDRERKTPATICTITEKPINKIEPKKEEKKDNGYIMLSDQDIENITNPQPENRNLTTADLRVLDALLETSELEVVLIDDLAKMINPNRISGFLREIASIPAIIDFCNKVVLKDTSLKISAKSGNFEDPEGYYITSTSRMHREIELRKAINIMKQNTDKPAIYRLLTLQNKDTGSLSLCIAKNTNKTQPIVLRDIVVRDNPELIRQPGNRGIKPNTYHLRAFNQARIVESLFKNKPIATINLRTELADDKYQISQRELQLLIDALNGNLPQNGGANIDSLPDLGLCITKKIVNHEECITLEKYDPNNFTPVHLSGQHDSAVADEGVIRQRRRRPSYKNMVL